MTCQRSQTEAECKLPVTNISIIMPDVHNPMHHSNCNALEEQFNSGMAPLHGVFLSSDCRLHIFHNFCVEKCNVKNNSSNLNLPWSI